MRTTLWNPWKDLERLQSELGRAFSGGLAGWDRNRAYPSVNLFQSEQGIVLTAELPGLSPDALDITVNPQSVTLRAERKPTEPKPGEAWVRRERPETSFSRTVELPVPVDPQSADAAYDKGVLTIRLHRPVEHRPKKVTVKAG